MGYFLLNFMGGSSTKYCPRGQYLYRDRYCYNCPVGRYYPYNSHRSTSCWSCPNGFYSRSRWSSCSSCSPGKYARVGWSSCSSCSPGYYSGTKWSSCGSCPVGWYQNLYTQGGCKRCSTGQYQNQIRQRGCKSCSTGQYQNQNAKSGCKSCQTGRFQNQYGKTSCKGCPAGWYQGQKGRNTCYKCAAGYYTDQTYQTSCKTCYAGQFQSGQGCVSCPAGQYQNQNGKSGCKTCPAGRSQSQSGKTSCNNCATGHFSAADRKSCTSCGPGTYLKSVTDSGCSDCVAGKYQDEYAKAICKLCDLGKASSSTKRTDDCDFCNFGKYQDQLGGSSCKTCAAGKFTSDDLTICYPTCPDVDGSDKNTEVCICGSAGQCEINSYCYKDYFCSDVQDGEFIYGALAEPNDKTRCSEKIVEGTFWTSIKSRDTCEEAAWTAPYSWLKDNSAYTPKVFVASAGPGVMKPIGSTKYGSSFGAGCIIGAAWTHVATYTDGSTDYVRPNIYPALCARDVLPKCPSPNVAFSPSSTTITKTYSGWSCEPGYCGNRIKFLRVTEERLRQICYNMPNCKGYDYRYGSNYGYICSSDYKRYTSDSAWKICPKIQGSTSIASGCSCNHYKCNPGQYCHSHNVYVPIEKGRSALTVDDIPCRDFPPCLHTNGLTSNTQRCVCNRRTCGSGESYCNFEKNTCSSQQNPTCSDTTGVFKNPGRCMCGKNFCEDSSTAVSGLYCNLEAGSDDGICVRGRECGLGTTPCLCSNIFGVETNPTCDCGKITCNGGNNNCLKSLEKCSSNGIFTDSKAYYKVFDGECRDNEIRMYEGNGDNPGKDHAAKLRACSDACLNKKSPLSGSWSGFVARGFIMTSSGRCYCESQYSSSCTRINNVYDRYDFLGSVTAKACDNNGLDDPCICNSVICNDENTLFCDPLVGCKKPATCSSTDLSVATNKYCTCGRTSCRSGQYCDSQLSLCSAFKGCGGDGYTLNDYKCQCGTSVCESGSYCLASSSLCFTQTPYPEFETCSSDNLAIVQDDCYLTDLGPTCADQGVCYTGDDCAQSGLNENVGHCMCSGRVCTTDTGLYCQSPQYSLQYTEKHDEYCNVHTPEKIEGMVELKQSCRQDSTCIGIRWFPEHGYGYKCKSSSNLGFANIFTRSDRLFKLESSTKCSAGPVCSNTDGTAENAVGCNCGGSVCNRRNGLYCFEEDAMCSDVPRCSNEDGTLQNTNACQCGLSKCNSMFWCLESHSFCAVGPECSIKDGATQNASPCRCGPEKNCDGYKLGCVVSWDHVEGAQARCLPEKCKIEDGSSPNEKECMCGEIAECGYDSRSWLTTDGPGPDHTNEYMCYSSYGQCTKRYCQRNQLIKNECWCEGSVSGKNCPVNTYCNLIDDDKHPYCTDMKLCETVSGIPGLVTSDCVCNEADLSMNNPFTDKLICSAGEYCFKGPFEGPHAEKARCLKYDFCSNTNGNDVSDSSCLCANENTLEPSECSANDYCFASGDGLVSICSSTTTFDGIGKCNIGENDVDCRCGSEVCSGLEIICNDISVGTCQSANDCAHFNGRISTNYVCRADEDVYCQPGQYPYKVGSKGHCLDSALCLHTDRNIANTDTCTCWAPGPEDISTEIVYCDKDTPFCWQQYKRCVPSECNNLDLPNDEECLCGIVTCPAGKVCINGQCGDAGSSYEEFGVKCPSSRPKINSEQKCQTAFWSYENVRPSFKGVRNPYGAMLGEAPFWTVSLPGTCKFIESPFDSSLYQTFLTGDVSSKIFYKLIDNGLCSEEGWEDVESFDECQTAYNSLNIQSLATVTLSTNTSVLNGCTGIGQDYTFKALGSSPVNCSKTSHKCICKKEVEKKDICSDGQYPICEKSEDNLGEPCWCHSELCNTNDVCSELEGCVVNDCLYTDGIELITNKCQCGASKCEIGTYCHLNFDICSSNKRCGASDGRQLVDEECQCGFATCNVNEYCNEQESQCSPASLGPNPSCDDGIPKEIEAGEICDNGFEDIQTWLQCKQSGEILGKSIGHSFDYGSYPFGCLLVDSFVYFNSHPTIELYDSPMVQRTKSSTPTTYSGIECMDSRYTQSASAWCGSSLNDYIEIDLLEVKEVSGVYTKGAPYDWPDYQIATFNKFKVKYSTDGTTFTDVSSEAFNAGRPESISEVPDNVSPTIILKVKTHPLCPANSFTPLSTNPFMTWIANIDRKLVLEGNNLYCCYKSSSPCGISGGWFSRTPQTSQDLEYICPENYQLNHEFECEYTPPGALTLFNSVVSARYLRVVPTSASSKQRVGRVAVYAKEPKHETARICKAIKSTERCQCGPELCAEGSWCVEGVCADKPRCIVLDGSAKNPVECQCGETECTGDSLYCYEKISTCSDSLDFLSEVTSRIMPVCENKNALEMVKEQCFCGKDECDVDEYCLEAYDTCASVTVCASKDASDSNYLGDCMCGSSICSGTDTFCLESESRCAKGSYCKITDGSSKNTGLGCMCGDANCEGDNQYCVAAQSRCAKGPLCVTTDGSAKNPGLGCMCGPTNCEGEDMFCHPGGLCKPWSVCPNIDGTEFYEGDGCLCGLVDCVGENKYCNNIERYIDPEYPSSSSWLDQEITGRCHANPTCLSQDGKILNNETACQCGYVTCSGAQMFCNTRENAVQWTPDGDFCSDVQTCSNRDRTEIIDEECQCGVNSKCSAGQYCDGYGKCHDTPICKYKDGKQANLVNCECYNSYEDTSAANNIVSYAADISENPLSCSATQSPYCYVEDQRCSLISYEIEVNFFEDVVFMKICDHTDGVLAHETSFSCRCGETAICDANVGMICDGEKCNKQDDCSNNEGLQPNGKGCRCGGTVCSSLSGYFCLLNLEQCSKDPMGPCENTDGLYINEQCTCTPEELCSKGQYCRDNQCSSIEPVCPDTTGRQKLNYKCKCGQSQTVCPADTYCYNGQCLSDARIDCIGDGITPNTNSYDCFCGPSKTCRPNEYCQSIIGHSCSTSERHILDNGDEIRICDNNQVIDNCICSEAAVCDSDKKAICNREHYQRQTSGKCYDPIDTTQECSTAYDQVTGHNLIATIVTNDEYAFGCVNANDGQSLFVTSDSYGECSVTVPCICKIGQCEYPTDCPNVQGTIPNDNLCRCQNGENCYGDNKYCMNGRCFSEPICTEIYSEKTCTCGHNICSPTQYCYEKTSECKEYNYCETEDGTRLTSDCTCTTNIITILEETPEDSMKHHPVILLKKSFDGCSAQTFVPSDQTFVWIGNDRQLVMENDYLYCCPIGATCNSIQGWFIRFTPSSADLEHICSDITALNENFECVEGITKTHDCQTGNYCFEFGCSTVGECFAIDLIVLDNNETQTNNSNVSNSNVSFVEITEQEKGNIILTEKCVCGGETCSIGQYCYKQQCRSNSRCTYVNGQAVNPSACSCGEVNCEANQYCSEYTNTCSENGLFAGYLIVDKIAIDTAGPDANPLCENNGYHSIIDPYQALDGNATEENCGPAAKFLGIELESIGQLCYSSETGSESTCPGCWIKGTECGKDAWLKDHEDNICSFICYSSEPFLPGCSLEQNVVYRDACLCGTKKAPANTFGCDPENGLLQEPEACIDGLNNAPCICKNNVCGKDTGLFCHLDSGRCSESKCDSTSGIYELTEDCACGNRDCKAGQYCLESLDKCLDSPQCRYPYGKRLDDIPCSCGRAECEAGQYCLGFLHQCSSDGNFTLYGKQSEQPDWEQFDDQEECLQAVFTIDAMTEYNSWPETESGSSDLFFSGTGFWAVRLDLPNQYSLPLGESSLWPGCALDGNIATSTAFNSEQKCVGEKCIVRGPTLPTCDNVGSIAAIHNSTGQCICGINICTSQTGFYCDLFTSTCSRVPTVCSEIYGNKENSDSCQCGDVDCNHWTGLKCNKELSQCSKKLFTVDGPPVYTGVACDSSFGRHESTADCICGTNVCSPLNGHFCNARTSKCSLPENQCEFTYGARPNTQACLCGTSSCNGVTPYCNSAMSQCSASSQKFTLYNAIPHTNFNTCEEYGMLPIDSELECKIGASLAIQGGEEHFVSGTASTGCVFDELFFEDYPAKTYFNVPDMDCLKHRCICKLDAPTCVDVFMQAPSTEKCICGSITCEEGYLCDAEHSRCVEYEKCEHLDEYDINSRTCSCGGTKTYEKKTFGNCELPVTDEKECFDAAQHLLNSFTKNELEVYSGPQTPKGCYVSDKIYFNKEGGDIQCGQFGPFRSGCICDTTAPLESDINCPSQQGICNAAEKTCRQIQECPHKNGIHENTGICKCDDEICDTHSGFMCKEGKCSHIQKCFAADSITMNLEACICGEDECTEKECHNKCTSGSFCTNSTGFCSKFPGYRGFMKPSDGGACYEQTINDIEYVSNGTSVIDERFCHLDIFGYEQRINRQKPCTRTSCFYAPLCADSNKPLIDRGYQMNEEDCQCRHHGITHCSPGQYCSTTCHPTHLCYNRYGREANDDCSCGNELTQCKADTNPYCLLSTSQCLDKPICKVTDPNLPNTQSCYCGDARTTCDETTGLYCHGDISRCSHRPCLFTEGLIQEDAKCACGTNDCDVNDHCFKESNFCGPKQCLSKDGLTISDESCICNDVACGEKSYCYANSDVPYTTYIYGSGATSDWEPLETYEKEAIQAFDCSSGNCYKFTPANIHEDKCWRRLPQACEKTLGEPGSGGTGLNWFIDPYATSSALCDSRIPNYNNYCGASGDKGIQTHWGKHPVSNQCRKMPVCENTDGTLPTQNTCSCAVATCQKGEYCYESESRCGQWPNEILFQKREVIKFASGEVSGRGYSSRTKGYIEVNGKRVWTQSYYSEISVLDKDWNLVKRYQNTRYSVYSGSSYWAHRYQKEVAQWMFDVLTDTSIEKGMYIAFTHTGHIGVLTEIKDGSRALSDLLEDLYGSKIVAKNKYGVWGRAGNYRGYGRNSMMFLLKKDIPNSMIIEDSQCCSKGVITKTKTIEEEYYPRCSDPTGVNQHDSFPEPEPSPICACENNLCSGNEMYCHGYISGGECRNRPACRYKERGIENIQSCFCTAETFCDGDSGRVCGKKQGSDELVCSHAACPNTLAESSIDKTCECTPSKDIYGNICKKDYCYYPPNPEQCGSGLLGEYPKCGCTDKQTYPCTYSDGLIRNGDIITLCICGTSTCLPNEFCNKEFNTCSKTPIKSCTYTDGIGVNTQACLCGSEYCGEGGYYCNATRTENKCHKKFCEDYEDIDALCDFVNATHFYGNGIIPGAQCEGTICNDNDRDTCCKKCSGANVQVLDGKCRALCSHDVCGDDVVDPPSKYELEQENLLGDISYEEFLSSLNIYYTGYCQGKQCDQTDRKTCCVPAKKCSSQIADILCAADKYTGALLDATCPSFNCDANSCCEQISCQCANGLAAQGRNCPAPGEFKCIGCNIGFWLEGITCRPARTCNPLTEYEFKPPGFDTDRICASLRTCNSKEFELIAPNVTTNRVCQRLTECASYQYVNKAAEYRYGFATPITDRTCANMTVCLSTQYESKAPELSNGFYVTDRICTNYSDTCSSDQYESKAPTETSDRECKPILPSCSENEFELQAPSATSNRVCQVYSPTCFFDQYESKAPTETSDRECKPITICQDDEFVTKQYTANSDRECQKLTVCTAEQYQSKAPEFSAGFYISNRECELLTVCNSDQYESSAPTSTSNRICSYCDPRDLSCKGCIIEDDCAYEPTAKVIDQRKCSKKTCTTFVIDENKALPSLRAGNWYRLEPARDNMAFDIHAPNLIDRNAYVYFELKVDGNSDVIFNNRKFNIQQDCLFEPYIWGQCSEMCGPGSEMGLRGKKIQDAKYGGIACSETPQIITRPCEGILCPIHCRVKWDEEFDLCQAKCGEEGIQIQNYTIIKQPQYGGNPCPPVRKRGCIGLPEIGDCDCRGRKYDECSVCGGDNKTCTGCDGVPNSGYKYNLCGECAPPGTICKLTSKVHQERKKNRSSFLKYAIPIGTAVLLSGMLIFIYAIINKPRQKRKIFLA